MSIASMSLDFMIGENHFRFMHDEICDVYYVTINSVKGLFKKYNFILIDHHTDNIMNDIGKQIVERICCEPLEDSDHILLRWFKDNGSIFGISREFIDELKEYNRILHIPTITPWLEDDYNSILESLKEMGFDVRRKIDYEHYIDLTECYIFTIKGKEISVRASHPLDWNPIKKGNCFDETPFYSLPYVIELLKEEIADSEKEDDDLLVIRTEKKKLN